MPKPTKLILSLTIFDEEINLHAFLSLFQQELGYDRLKQTTGVHEHAHRIHRHFMVIYKVAEGDKIYKTLNKKAHTLWKSIQLYDKIDFKVTFTYNNDGYKSNPKNVYDETCLMYPFKEYKKDDDIEYSMQHGYSIPELHSMRAEAHAKWNKVCQAKQKKQQEEAAKTNKKEQLYLYLEQKTQYMRTSQMPHVRKIRETVLLILDYKKQVDESFRVYDLKNIAINYLFKYSMMTEHDIVEILNL